MLRQIIYDMRHHRMMTWISIAGTAVSIFLVMVFYMSDSVKTVSMAPELDRDRIWVGAYVDIQSTDPEEHSSSSGGLSYEAARQLYGDLDGVEKISYVGAWSRVMDILIKGQPPVRATVFPVDGSYWDIYRFRFIEGHPFTDEECTDDSNLIVVSRSLAHRLFKSTEIVGREVNIQGKRYMVCGVVDDVNPLMSNTGFEAFISLSAEHRNSWNSNPKYQKLGSLKVLLKYAGDTDPEAVRSQVKARYATMNAQLAPEMVKAEYHGSPFDLDTQVSGKMSGNLTPDLSAQKRKRWFMYGLLILLPAINLSSMTRGRLRHRVSELGVRRAFGAKRVDIVKQLLGENLIVTVIGGCLGLLCSVLFMLFLSAQFFSYVDFWMASSMDMMMANPSLQMVFTWKTFLIALGACLLLNILTATVPAWRSSLIPPAAAISKSKI